MIDALPLLLGDDGYQISRSVRLRSSASAYFNRTPGSATNRKTFTLNFWLKRGELGTRQVLFSAGTGANAGHAIELQADNTLTIYANNTGAALTLTTSQVFRDPSAHGMLTIAFDTTQATASNRVKVYWNGSQITAFSTATYPSQNADLEFNNNVPHNIGRREIGTTFYCDVYLTEINFIDGQALTPSSFGITDAITGVWKPQKYIGTYGTNGFYLNFSDNSSNTATTIGKDYSGNGNNWTPNNISVTSGATYDSMLDVPTPWADGGNGRGNYAVLNPLAVGANSSQITFSNANLTATWSSASGYATAIGTIGVSSGKWYWEVVNTSAVNSNIGVVRDGDSLAAYVGQTANGYSVYSGNGNKYNNGSAASYTSAIAQNDVVGVALDMDAGTLTFYKNGVSLGQAYSGLSGTFFPAVSDGDTSAAVSLAINFGQRPLSYSPPSGFKTLCATNLPEPTIKKGASYFDINLWTGNGSSQTITNAAGFAPDLVWVKERSSTSGNVLVDSVRGAGVYLESNATAAEGTDATTVSALNSNGFSVGSSGATNQSGQTNVGWQWKEGATQGFDIVTYTGNGVAGRTVSHSLGVSPGMVIVKNRSSGTPAWMVAHSGMTAGRNMILNGTDAQFLPQNAAYGGITSFNSTTFTTIAGTLGQQAINANGDNYVAYCFAPVSGYSAFGSYTGNGSADGPFVFCGFRPAYVMIKRTDTANDWAIHDKARIGYNVANYHLLANSSGAEFTDIPIDLLSNGFKLRGTSGTENASGGTYIYAAFAENPFKNALAR